MSAILTLAALATTGLVDFGPEGVGGYPVVEIDGVASSAVVRVEYATSPEGLRGKGDFQHETRATYLGEDVWLPILPANTDRFDDFAVASNGVYRAPLAQGLVRYAKWTLLSGCANVRNIQFANDGIHSEESVQGAFSCSDTKVDGVWKASVRTCQLAAIPGRTTPLSVKGARTNAVLGASYAYLSDGAKRDRLVWSGDLWWAQRNMYVAFSPCSPYLPGSIRMLGENQLPNGYVPACPYPESHAPAFAEDYGPFGSDEFAAWFVPIVADHWLYTADENTTREAYPRIVRLMDYLAAHQRADGIFEPRPETSKNAAGLVFGAKSLHHRAFMNILLWKSYVDAARLARDFGTPAEVARWESAAVRLAVVIRANFWDAARGWFANSLEERCYAPEANPLALATRFLTAEEAARLMPQLKFHNHGKFQALAARGCFEYGAAARAMELIARHNWYRILEPSWKGLRTVTECMHMVRNGWSDEAHPDTAIASLFTNYLLGVEPLEPGYRRFRVKPQPAAGITSARGRVPTPYGFIDVAWRLENEALQLEVSAPPACYRVRDAR